MAETRTDRGALLCMLAGAALIGTNALMVRLAGTPPTVSAFWRMLFAAGLLLLFVVARGHWRPLSRRTCWWVLLPAAAFAADLWLWHRSIALVGPGLATLLANAQVFFMAVAGMVFYGERLGPRFLAGIVLSFAGLWLMLGGEWSSLPADYRWGVWLGLATGVCYAIYNLGLKRVQHEARAPVGGATSAGPTAAPIEQVLALVSLACAILLGLAVLAEGAAFAIPTWRAFWILLLLASVGHCLSWVLISRAMQHLRVALVGLLLLLQPIVAFLLDVGVLDRGTTPREWLGLAISLAGIFLASVRPRIAEPVA